MGRGRAKAKQTKVARELKYNTPGLDPERLQAELGGPPSSSDHDETVDEDDDADPYARYVDRHSE